MIKAGILSDTHITTVTEDFRTIAQKAFADCDVIFHAGDITDKVVLQVFAGKTVHAVHGNMCNPATQKHFPECKTITLDGYTIGLCHGTGPLDTIEERMWALFSEADCIIYGHSHQPICQKKGGILYINPGSFQYTGPYGAPPSYALLEIDHSGLKAQLQTLTLRQ